MPLGLARIDDRLIHGQVTVGWATHLKPKRIILASNEIAADPWQSQVYTSSVPPRIQVSILSLAETVSFLAGDESMGPDCLLLTGSAGEMAQLASMGLDLERVNVGGLHFSPGKKELLPFVYLSRSDLAALHQLLERGLTLSAQQVPGGKEWLINEGSLRALEDTF